MTEERVPTVPGDFTQVLALNTQALCTVHATPYHAMQHKPTLPKMC